MEASENIKRLAKSEGFPEVKYIGNWRDYDLFSAFNPSAPYVGMPQYILFRADEKPRWASVEETEEIMASRAN